MRIRSIVRGQSARLQCDGSVAIRFAFFAVKSIAQANDSERKRGANDAIDDLGNCGAHLRGAYGCALAQGRRQEVKRARYAQSEGARDIVEPVQAGPGVVTGLIPLDLLLLQAHAFR